MFANDLGCTQSTLLPWDVRNQVDPFADIRDTCRHPMEKKPIPYEQFVEYDRLTEAKIQALLKENARLRRALGENGGNAQQHTKVESFEPKVEFVEQKQPPKIERTQAFMYTLDV